MKYNEFIELIRKEVQIKLGDEYNITISRVQKNNGIILKGISITNKNLSISPVFYLNDQYRSNKENLNERSIRETAGDIIRIYFDYCPSEEADINFFKTYQDMKGKVLFRLINYNKNIDLLKKIPHKRFYDLAMVFYCDVNNDFFENGTILFYNSHLELWNVTVDDIYKDAVTNTPKVYPVQIQSMSEVMKELLENKIRNMYGDDEKADDIIKDIIKTEYNNIKEDKLMQDEKRYKMYVAGNNQKIYGAAVMLYPDFLKNFAEEIAADIYIFPSSVHEIIITPAKKYQDRKELLKMVCDINANQVNPEEVLADTVYYYDRASGLLEMIN